ncbi:MAG: hypothetical protein WDN10_01140 [bacterium]
MEHHAYLAAGPAEEGRAAAIAAAAKLVGGDSLHNPDIIVREYGLFSVDDARALYQLAWQAPLKGEKKAIIISATRLYHEAQNALLKLFEEPPADTALYLVIPHAGSLIPTLRSRLLPLPDFVIQAGQGTGDEAKQFLGASPEKRSDMIKKLADAKGEERKRVARDTAVSILDGVERAAYERWQAKKEDEALAVFLSDISLLRGYLHDRSAPLRMILEHVSLTLPKGLTS